MIRYAENKQDKLDALHEVGKRLRGSLIQQVFNHVIIPFAKDFPKLRTRIPEGNGKHDVSFYNNEEKAPYAITLNNAHILFYFRKPLLERYGDRDANARKKFYRTLVETFRDTRDTEVKEFPNKFNEITVRIETPKQAQALIGFIANDKNG